MITKLKALWTERMLATLLLFLAIVAGTLAVSALIHAAWAAPFLVCDPYPPEGQQPTEFIVTISGLSAPIVTPAVDTPTGKILRLDLGPLNLSGARTVTAQARNSWGTSADSLPLAFTAGPPAPVTGITLWAY